MKSKSFHKKLTASYIYLLAAVAAIMLLGFVLTVWFSVLPSMRITMQSKTNELSNRLDEQCSYLMTAVDSAFLSLNNLDSSVLFPESGGSLQKYNSINNVLYLTRQMYDGVLMMFLFDTDGIVYADNSLLEAELGSSFDSEYHNVLEDKRGKTYSFGLRELPLSEEGEPVLLVGKMLRYIDNIRKIGYIYACAESSTLQKLYEEQMICAGQRIYLCDENGTVLSSTESDALGTALDISYNDRVLDWFDGNLWLCQRKVVESLHAELILLIPALELYKSSGISAIAVLAALLIGLAVAMVQAGSITKRTLAPLTALTNTANEINEGNMQVRCDESSESTEIAVLSKSYNSMLDRIEQLISRLDTVHREKLRTELAVQQNKIQPHFLYNVLNTISAMCEMEQGEDASRISHMAAEYYRSVLSDGQDIVSIEQELEHVQLYFDITSHSRSDKIEYTLCCEPEAARLPIPKMTIQPLVENAVKHAFFRPGGNKLDVSVSVRGGQEVTIIVADNGVGMDTAHFEEVLSGRCEGHFGLYSVRRCMELLCGGQYSIEAISEKMKGTEIILRYNAGCISANGREHD